MLMPLKTQMEAKPGAVIHTYVSVVSVPSIVGSMYFVTFIEEASCPVRALQMKSNCEASELESVKSVGSSHNRDAL